MSKKPKQIEAPAGNVLQAFGARNRDIGFALGVVLILMILFVPLPPILLDLGLAISLAISVLVLMVALWIPKPLEFNSFPTLLLVVTMLRLSLNVSSTRLILSEGHTGTSAAGNVIEGFSRFIVGGNFVIGIVIFAILVIINFMVITKGSTRIAEVSARFTLDAIPGKQMAIDADLGSGAINDEEARRRRKELEEESSFFGAMDGASKFVRGDAVAGLIITVINIVGGIIIGVMQHELSVGEAANNYTTLTIGDGLVSQIPALVVSLAAGLIVTKGATTGAANEAVIGQLNKFPRAMYVAAALLLGMGMLPGFPFIVFALLATGLAALARFTQNATRAQEEAARRAEEAEDLNTAYAEETPQEILRLDAIRLDLGAGLVPMIQSMDTALPGKVSKLRNIFAKEYGFILPFVRIKDEPDLGNHHYCITIHGVNSAEGEIRPTLMMAILPGGGGRVELEGVRVKEPAFGLPAVWIDPAHAEKAEKMGYTVVDPESVIVTHLTETIKKKMPELLTFAATQKLIDSLERDYQKLVSNLPGGSPVQLVQSVLQRLLAEKVSVRNLPLIAEAISEAAQQSQNHDSICEAVRWRLANQICESLKDPSGFIPVITLSEEWENEFTSSMEVIGGVQFPKLDPQRVYAFVNAARRAVQPFAQRDENPAILVNSEFRPHVRKMLQRVCANTPILGTEEVHRSGMAVNTLAKVEP